MLCANYKGKRRNAMTGKSRMDAQGSIILLSGYGERLF